MGGGGEVDRREDQICEGQDGPDRAEEHEIRLGRRPGGPIPLVHD